jgi:hypothetical protein
MTQRDRRPAGTSSGPTRERDQELHVTEEHCNGVSFEMNCWYCKKHKSIRLCGAGKPLYDVYATACQRYHQGKRVGEPGHHEAWMDLLTAMRAYYTHVYQEAEL